MYEYIFKKCQVINDLLTAGNESEGRNELIKLLDYHSKNKIEYSPVVNHLIRETGLYPYIDNHTADWEDKFVQEAFKVNIGGGETRTLHREQSFLLKELLDGKNIAVSAPTSFGKSFVIDAFISLKCPNNVVIIVPTIALADETRRRLYKKYASQYKIITTQDVVLGEKNILIFPQERAMGYVNKINDIDILIIDEFYKADIAFDKERAPTLLKAILELEKKAKQKYFLSPNISEINDNPITKDMEFIPLDFNTVFSEIHNSYEECGKERPDEKFKAKKLLDILKTKETKSLIYAGTFSNIDYITNALNENLPELDNEVLNNFSDWLKLNYSEHYRLADLVRKGVGIHNGRLHRSLSQIQIKLFGDEKKLNNIISTSSIIEGVNTSAENVIIWANKNGRFNLNDFTYKNIIGRGGRMFKHFVGQIYLLEPPPTQRKTQLSLDFTDDLLCSLDKERFKGELTREQEIKIIAFNDEMNELFGNGVYNQILKNNLFQTVNSSRLKNIACDMKNNPKKWSGLSRLNSVNPDDWDNSLYMVCSIIGNVGVSYSDIVSFIKVISQSWDSTIPQLLPLLQGNNVAIEEFFYMERIVCSKIAAILSDINVLYNHLFPQNHINIGPFIAKASRAFLPRLVYELEEYGLPRMVSQKIHDAGLINLEDNEKQIHEAISCFNKLGLDTLKRRIRDLHPFENYILEYFFDGIKSY